MKMEDEVSSKVIESCSLDKLANSQIFLTNPKLYIRLKLVTDTDNFYEAHQLYKTIHFRYLNDFNQT